MADIEKQVTVDRPPEVVRAFILDADRATAWQGNLEEYEQLSPGPPEQGAQARGAVSVVGRRLEWTAELSACADLTWTWTSVVSDPPWENIWTLVAVEGGTSVTFEQSSPGLAGIGGAIARNILGAQAEKDLASLKEMVEAG